MTSYQIRSLYFPYTVTVSHYTLLSICRTTKMKSVWKWLWSIELKNFVSQRWLLDPVHWKFIWNTRLLNLDIQDSWDLFTKTVHSSIDKYIPASTTTSRNKPRKTWVNAVVNNYKKKGQSWTKLCHANANRHASVEDKLKVHQDWIAARNK